MDPFLVPPLNLDMAQKPIVEVSLPREWIGQGGLKTAPPP